MSDTIFQEETVVKKDADKSNSLIIFNDDVNTFDFVIDSLVKVCEHEMVQAEQCTWIIHYNGKCSVKDGSIESLTPMKKALCERGLDAKIN